MGRTFPVAVMFILTHLSLIFFMYPTYIVSATTSGHWLPIVIGYLVHLLIIGLYMKGLSYFKGQDIVDILTARKLTSIFILAPVTVYLVLLAVVSMRAITEIITIVYLSRTPMWSIMVLFLVISGYIAYLGVKSLFRTAVLMGLVFVPIIFLVIICSFQNVDWRYMFPLFNKEMLDFSFLRKEAYYKGGFAFTGAFVYLGLITKQFPYKAKNIMFSSLILLPLFLLAVYIPVMTFGENTASQFQFPFITSMDTVEINWLMFDRVTIFFVQSLVAFVILFIALVVWEAVTIMKRTVLKIHQGYIIGGILLIVFISALKIPDWEVMEKVFYWNTLLRTYIIIVLPLTLLLLGIIRKNRLTDR